MHALSVVSHEEYSDAQDILKPERGGGGVLRSAYTNKMNEVKPHRAWAERTLQRAEVFGVANEDIGFVELLAAKPADLNRTGPTNRPTDLPIDQQGIDEERGVDGDLGRRAAGRRTRR